MINSSLIKMPGAKSRLFKKYYIPLIPPHDIYVDGFMGTGACTIRKTKSPVEICYDINWDIINLFNILKKDDSFINSLKHINYSEIWFTWANYHDSLHETDRTRAIAYLIRNRFSRDANGKDYTWSDRLRRGMPEQVSSWESMKAALPKIRSRIRDITFENRNFLEVIKNNNYLNSPNVFYFLDCPYPHSCRESKDLYGQYEMTDDQHVELLNSIKDYKSKILLCSYNNDIYNSILKNFRKIEVPVKVNMGTKSRKNIRLEVIYLNY